MTVNAIDRIRVSDWIGHDLERLRKLRGLRREDVAAQLTVPVSASTIRNIEHDEHYNVSLDLLRQIAAVLGADLRVSIDVREDSSDEIEGSAIAVAPGRRLVDNEYFIRYIREHYPECPLTNSQIGRRMWSFAESRGAELVRGRKQLKRVEAAGTLAGHRSPTTAAEYQVWEKDFVALQRFADRVGRAFSDGKGGFLVPAA